MKSHVSTSCYLNPVLLYTMHTLRFHMILMHDQQNPLTTCVRGLTRAWLNYSKKFTLNYIPITFFCKYIYLNLNKDKLSISCKLWYIYVYLPYTIKFKAKNYFVLIFFLFIGPSTTKLWVKSRILR